MLNNSKEYVESLRNEPASRLFWRDVFAEFIATFFLVSIQASLPLSWGQGSGGPMLTGLGMGFVVCALAWTMGDFGGGHMNPAVSFAMAVCLKITVLRALAYMVAQCLGAVTGAAFVYLITPEDMRETLAATTLNNGVTPVQGVVTEAWITCLLVTTILGSTNTDRKRDIYMPTIPIGFAVALGIMVAFYSTGGSMNPARSLGPAVVMGLWTNHWVYWIGPMLGSGLAVLMYFLFDRVDSIDSCPPSPAKPSLDTKTSYIDGIYITTM